MPRITVQYDRTKSCRNELSFNKAVTDRRQTDRQMTIHNNVRLGWDTLHCSRRKLHSIKLAVFRQMSSKSQHWDCPVWYLGRYGCKPEWESQKQPSSWLDVGKTCVQQVIMFCALNTQDSNTENISILNYVYSWLATLLSLYLRVAVPSVE